jgi:hypothetical protein
MSSATNLQIYYIMTACSLTFLLVTFFDTSSSSLHVRTDGREFYIQILCKIWLYWKNMNQNKIHLSSICEQYQIQKAVEQFQK